MQNNIKELRIKFKLTQGELALKVGTTRQTINELENGKRKPSLMLAHNISTFFNLSINDIFFKDVVMQDKQTSFIA